MRGKVTEGVFFRLHNGSIMEAERKLNGSKTKIFRNMGGVYEIRGPYIGPYRALIGPYRAL